MSANLPPLPRGRRMGSGVINGKLIELFMHDDAAMLAYATKAVAAQATEVEALRADAERGRFMIAWAERNGLIDAQFCQPPGAPSGDYYILRGVAIINGNDCAGFGKTPQEAVDAARAALKENP